MPSQVFIILGKKQDDLVKLLSVEPDFAAAKPMLQEVLEARGCKVLFGVKFHPELMMIESCYRSALFNQYLFAYSVLNVNMAIYAALIVFILQ